MLFFSLLIFSYRVFKNATNKYVEKEGELGISLKFFTSWNVYFGVRTNLYFNLGRRQVYQIVMYRTLSLQADKHFTIIIYFTLCWERVCGLEVCVCNRFCIVSTSFRCHGVNTQ